MNRKIGVLVTLRRAFRRKISEVGISAAIRLLICRLISELRTMVSKTNLAEDAFDLQYGTDTGGIIEPGALDIPDDRLPHAVRYQTAQSEVFNEILNSLPIPYDRYLFVDLGSGKGRALLLASRFPFKGIIGVELSQDLHRIACRNIQIHKHVKQRCNEIQSVHKDAADWEIPPERIIFYMFNPFDRHVFSMVLSNIEDSLHKHPREILIAYLKPVCRDTLDRSPYFRLLKATDRYVIYHNEIS